jgi:hypothetical protein
MKCIVCSVISFLFLPSIAIALQTDLIAQKEEFKASVKKLEKQFVDAMRVKAMSLLKNEDTVQSQQVLDELNRFLKDGTLPSHDLIGKEKKIYLNERAVLQKALIEGYDAAIALVEEQGLTARAKTLSDEKTRFENKEKIALGLVPRPLPPKEAPKSVPVSVELLEKVRASYLAKVEAANSLETTARKEDALGKIAAQIQSELDSEPSWTWRFRFIDGRSEGRHAIIKIESEVEFAEGWLSPRNLKLPLSNPYSDSDRNLPVLSDELLVSLQPNDVFEIQGRPTFWYFDRRYLYTVELQKQVVFLPDGDLEIGVFLDQFKVKRITPEADKR